MSLYPNDTIAAIATARGDAGVAVVRVSGPKALVILERVFQPSSQTHQFEHGRFYHGFVVDAAEGFESGVARTPRSEIIIDESIVLVFKAPHSLTGEDVIEIQCHGGDYLAHQVLNAVLTQGARMAQAGEFTKRAFLNGKMDLTQAESVMDLVSAKSDRMLAAAAANLKNRSLSQYLEEVRVRLIAMQSQVTASIDFPDEVDEPDRGALKSDLENFLQKLKTLAEATAKNRVLRDGLTVAIVGLPNAGKSSLFNALLASERAIVTDIAGTTRDVITETLQVEGIPVTLIDTAGIRETGNTIEILGIERTWQAVSAAQAVVYVYDAGTGFSEEDARIVSRLPQQKIMIANKCDLLNGNKPEASHLKTSVKTGEGVTDIFAFLSGLAGKSGKDADAVVLLNRRQEVCLLGIVENLALAVETVKDTSHPMDLLSVPLTDALLKIDELTGRDTREEVLDSVFSQFCVGK